MACRKIVSGRGMVACFGVHRDKGGAHDATVVTTYHGVFLRQRGSGKKLKTGIMGSVVANREYVVHDKRVCYGDCVVFVHCAVLAAVFNQQFVPSVRGVSRL